MSMLGGGLLGASGGAGGGGGGSVPDTVLAYHTDTSAGETALLGGDITGLNAGGLRSISIVLGGVAANLAAGNDSVVIGSSAKTSAGAYSSVVLGHGANVSDYNTIAIGASVAVTGSGGTAIGASSDAVGGGSAYGSLTQATGTNSSAFGRGADATMTNSSAFGSNAQATKDGAYALGSGEGALGAPDADGLRSGAFGPGAVVNVADSVQFGNGTNSTANTFQISGMDLTVDSGVLSLTEITTPTARTNYGKIYTKTDNILYFQDGAGTEHDLVSGGGGIGNYTATGTTTDELTWGSGTLTTGDLLTLSAGADITTGTLLNVESSIVDSSIRDMIHIDHTATTSANTVNLRLTQASNSEALIATGGTALTTANLVELSADNLTQGSVLKVSSNGLGTDTRSIVDIHQDHASASGATALTVTQDSTALAIDCQGDLAVATKTPASASATGITGTVTWDGSYIYICSATDTWLRASIATW